MNLASGVARCDLSALLASIVRRLGLKERVPLLRAKTRYRNPYTAMGWNSKELQALTASRKAYPECTKAFQRPEMPIQKLVGLFRMGDSLP